MNKDLVEQLARAIHYRHQRSQAGRKSPSDPSLAPWSDLDETLKASNRSQAADIIPKLRAIGCRTVPADAAGLFAFTPDEVEQLAEREHERWVADRRAHGWISGAEPDPVRRVTPFMVAYHELPEEIRELDREAVRSIPALLRGIGLAIRRDA
jgi:hypothetical protein